MADSDISGVQMTTRRSAGGFANRGARCVEGAGSWRLKDTGRTHGTHWWAKPPHDLQLDAQGTLFVICDC
jgi:hypothetical protein